MPSQKRLENRTLVRTRIQRKLVMRYPEAATIDMDTRELFRAGSALWLRPCFADARPCEKSNQGLCLCQKGSTRIHGEFSRECREQARRSQQRGVRYENSG